MLSRSLSVRLPKCKSVWFKLDIFYRWNILNWYYRASATSGSFSFFKKKKSNICTLNCRKHTVCLFKDNYRCKTRTFDISNDHHDEEAVMVGVVGMVDTCGDLTDADHLLQGHQHQLDRQESHAFVEEVQGAVKDQIPVWISVWFKHWTQLKGFTFSIFIFLVWLKQI